jgi:hypothetical protein
MDRNERQISKERQQSAVMALALVSVVLGIIFVAFMKFSAAQAAPIALLLVFAARPLVKRVWHLASFALRGPPPPGPPRIPSEHRLCPVCGSILQRKQLADGWYATCPACNFRRLLER